MTLEQIVCLARLRIEVAPNSVIEPGDVDIRIANAVRAFLGSEEVVDAMCKAHCDHFGGEGWWETGLLKDTLPEARKAMRAALSSIGGE